MRQIIKLLLLFVVVPYQAQNPWTQKKGKTYTQLSFSTISNYDKLYGNPDYSTERKITDNTLRFYGEYGITEKTTFFIGVPLKTVKSEELVKATNVPVTSEGSITSMGNILLGIKHNFYNNKWLITGQIGVESNTQQYNAATGLRTGYDAYTITSLITIGRGFNLWYIQAYSGIDYRTNNYSAAFKIGGEIGYHIASWFVFSGFADGLASFTNGDVITPTQNRLTGLYVDKQSYAAFGLKSIFKVNQEFGVNLGVGLALDGRNVASKPAITTGIYYKFL